MFRIIDVWEDKVVGKHFSLMFANRKKAKLNKANDSRSRYKVEVCQT